MLCCIFLLVSIGEVPSCSTASSSSSDPLSKTGFPSLLTFLESKADVNDSSDEDYGTTDNAEGETTLSDILTALEKAEERIMEAIRNNMHITKVKNFVYEDSETSYHDTTDI
jgi:hypothetical protein